MAKKISALMRLFRLELPLAMGVCVVAGQIQASNALPSPRIALLGFTCGFAFSSAALILNDYFDLEVDRINAPDRPLPTGAVTGREAVALTILMTIVGLAAALALGPAKLVLGLVFWTIGFLYNWRFKQSGLPGNLMVAVSIGATFVLGAVTVGSPLHPLAWTFGLIAFLIDLGAEIAGGAMDMEGDRVRGCHSIALQSGRRFSLKISAALWGVAVVLIFLPILFGWLAARYLVFCILAAALISFFTLLLLQSRSREIGRRAVRGVYLGAIAGLSLGTAGFFYWGSLI
jgi:geranylgeranylglycerol-phosphate geranylgeranyltransferase